MKKLTLIAAIIISVANLIGQSFQIDIPGKEINLETYNLDSKSDFLKQPYLIFEGVNTQMRVIWQLAETATCQISWGTDSTYSLGSANTEEYGDDHQHGYTITGLTPGMKYHYKVVYDDDIIQASFLTAPPEDAENIKFFVYGDTRSDFVNHNLNSQAMVEDYIADPDFQTLTLFTGDHVFYGADESSWTGDFFTNSAPFVRKRMAEVPFISCLGNHELYGSDYILHHDTELFGKYFPFPFVERRYWSFDYGPMHVCVLDQYPDYYQLLPLEGFLDSLRLVWLEQDLSSTDKPWKVIILHEPGWSCEGSSSGYAHPNNPDVQNLLQPLMEEYGVQILFSAHNHYYARACKNGIYHITTAGGGAPLYEIEEEFPNVINTLKVHHYCRVEIEEDTMIVTAVKPDGEVIDLFYIDQNNRPDHLLGFLDKEDGPGDISDVNIAADGQITSPDSVGYYGLELVSGYHDATFLLSGYVPLTETVEITEGTETQLDTMLMLGQGCLPEGISFTTQQEIDNFQTNYPDCTEIEGNVQIEGDEITNLNGLGVLTNIGGRLRFYTCTALPDLTGLENLTSIGGNLIIYSWPSATTILTSLSGLDNLESVGGDLEIGPSDALLSLNGLGSLTSVGGQIQIDGNEVLPNLAGLESLTTIGEGVWIGENAMLTSLSGLESLETIGETFEIYESDALINFTGLNNLSTIGGVFKVNYNNTLSSFSGLDSLTSIGGYLEINYNDALTSLTGLDNIAAGTISDIYIEENPMLSTCHVTSICNYLSAPNGDIEISNNAPGCNDFDEVWDACFNLVDESYNLFDLSISPNPVNDYVVLSLNTQSQIMVAVCICNTTGICLKNWQFQHHQAGEKEFTLDLKDLPAGIYFCRAQIGNEIVTKKIIKL
ncbi:MAG: metallophosphoesterase [Bacteroidales bacterium]